MKNKVFFYVKKYEICLLFIFIIILQIVVAAFYMNSKQFLHIDELYCYEGAHNVLLYRFVDPEFRLITNEEWYNKWHTKEEFMSHFEVRGGESILRHPLTELKSTVKSKHIYYVLLNIAESFQSDPTLTKWAGFALNSIIFILHQIVFYLVGQEIFRDKRKALLPMLIFGFSAGAITLTTYIRFYLLKSLLCLIIAYIHIKLLTWKNIWGVIAAYAVTGIAVQLIWGNQPYIILYAASAVFVFMMICLIKREYKLLLQYIGIGGAGALAVILLMRSIMVQLKVYAKSDYGVSTIANFLGRPIGEYAVFLKFYFMKSLSHVAGGVYTIAVVLIILAAIWWVQKKKGKVQWTKFEYFNAKTCYIVGVSICYFIINCRIQDVKEYRYMSCIYPGLCVGIAVLLEWVLDSCQVRARSTVICAVILVGVFFGYLRGYVDEMYPEVADMRLELTKYPTADSLFITPEEEMRQYYRDGYLSNDGTRLYLMSPDSIDVEDYAFLSELDGEGFLCWLPYVFNGHYGENILDQILVNTDYGEYEKVMGTYQSNVYYVH